jgi:hypothetical protein
MILTKEPIIRAKSKYKGPGEARKLRLCKIECLFSHRDSMSSRLKTKHCCNQSGTVHKVNAVTRVNSYSNILCNKGPTR